MERKYFRVFFIVDGGLCGVVEWEGIVCCGRLDHYAATGGWNRKWMDWRGQIFPKMNDKDGSFWRIDWLSCSCAWAIADMQSEVVESKETTVDHE